jgi:hypothetical protein
MKFKKGSAEAKAFMKKLRAARGKKKKPAAKKLTKYKSKLTKKWKPLKYTDNVKELKKYGYKLAGTEKHTDIKSHNYKISIGNVKSPFKTMAEVRAANAKNGFMFFSPKTMKFFGSKIVTPLLMGRYFITSEKQRYSSGETETTYTIRKAEDNGKIETIWKTGSINHFKTKEEAKQYLKKLY